MRRRAGQKGFPIRKVGNVYKIVSLEPKVFQSDGYWNRLVEIPVYGDLTEYFSATVEDGKLYASEKEVVRRFGNAFPLEAVENADY